MKLACFIILHYKTTAQTLHCIKSLLQLNNINACKIIVFDNGSANHSVDKIEKVYGKHPAICIIKSEKNLGFSQGNNLAYKQAKAFNPQFIIALNNDVYIEQKDFLLKICEVYRDKKFHILGPDIYVPHMNWHQNPLYLEFPTIEQLEAEIELYRTTPVIIDTRVKKERVKQYKYWAHQYIPELVWSIYRQLKKVCYPSKEKLNNIYTISHENPVLFGACLIFSPLYIENNTKLFEPETHLYFEELLLSLKCNTLNYRTVYSPELHVMHYHSASTKKSTHTLKKWLLYNAENMVKAYDVLVETMRDNPWQKNH